MPLAAPEKIQQFWKTWEEGLGRGNTKKSHGDEAQEVSDSKTKRKWITGIAQTSQEAYMKIISIKNVVSKKQTTCTNHQTC